MNKNANIRNKLEVSIEPNNFWRKKCNVYGADFMDIDWKSLQEEEKDYSREAFQEYVLSKIKAISKLDLKEQIELSSPNKSELIHITQEKEQQERLQKQKQTDEEYEKVLEEIRVNPSPNIDKLVWEVKEWLDLVLSDKTQTRTLFVCGRVGVGKTHTIKKVLKQHFEVEQLKKIIQGGSITPLKYYCNLYDNPNGIFYWNDLDRAFFTNSKSISMLKQSGDVQLERKVDYDTTSPKLGNRLAYCIFRGKQIFDLSSYPNNDEFKAILSRSPPVNFNPTNNELVIMGYEIIKEDFMDIPLKDKMKVMDYIKRNVNPATKDFDLRKVVWFMDLFRHCNGINEKFILMSKSLLEVDEGKEIVVQLNKKGLSTTEQLKEYMSIAEERGLPKSRATFFNYLSEVKNG